MEVYIARLYEISVLYIYKLSVFIILPVLCMDRVGRKGPTNLLFFRMVLSLFY